MKPILFPARWLMSAIVVIAMLAGSTQAQDSEYEEIIVPCNGGCGELDPSGVAGRTPARRCPGYHIQRVRKAPVKRPEEDWGTPTAPQPEKRRSSSTDSGQDTIRQTQAAANAFRNAFDLLNEENKKQLARDGQLIDAEAKARAARLDRLRIQLAETEARLKRLNDFANNQLPQQRDELKKIADEGVVDARWGTAGGVALGLNGYSKIFMAFAPGPLRSELGILDSAASAVASVPKALAEAEKENLPGMVITPLKGATQAADAAAKAIKDTEMKNNIKPVKAVLGAAAAADRLKDGDLPGAGKELAGVAATFANDAGKRVHDGVTGGINMADGYKQTVDGLAEQDRIRQQAAALDQNAEATVRGRISENENKRAALLDEITAIESEMPSVAPK